MGPGALSMGDRDRRRSVVVGHAYSFDGGGLVLNVLGAIPVPARTLDVRRSASQFTSLSSWSGMRKTIGSSGAGGRTMCRLMVRRAM